MAVKTASCIRDTKTGKWTARRAIPHALRAAYKEAFGAAHEAKQSWSAGYSESEVRPLVAEWQASIESRFQRLRDAAAGKGSNLSLREAHALAGRLYQWLIKNGEAIGIDNPRWDKQLALFRDRHCEEAELPTSIRFERIAQFVGVDQFLADENELLTPSARLKFVEAAIPEIEAAYSLLARRECGDYSPDERPQKFPIRNKAAGLTIAGIFDAYVLGAKPARNTVIRWKSVFSQLDRFFTGRDAGSLTDADAFDWREDLRKRLSAKSVNEQYVVAAKAVFNWAVNERKLSHNPFASLKSISGDRKVKNRERSFRDAELETIFKATLEAPPPRMQPHHANARRWVPWLCGYSGARPGEICQLRKEDVIQIRKQWALLLTPDAGTIKDKEARHVPLHEHLIAQGFIEFVQNAPKGPLFYNPALLRKKDDDPTNPRRAPAEKTRMRLAEWIRDIGVTDPDISPNHAFRHTWKTRALRAGVDKTVRDFIQGHAPETEGDAYTALEGEEGFEILAREMAKFPRYLDRVPAQTPHT